MTSVFKASNHPNKDDPMRRDNSHRDYRSLGSKTVILFAIALVASFLIFSISGPDKAKNAPAVTTDLSRTSPLPAATEANTTTR